MRAWRWIIACLALAGIAGCGGGSILNTNTKSSAVPSSGNWAFTPVLSTSAGSSATLPPFPSGSLEITGQQVAANLLTVVFTSSCPLPLTPGLAFTGTVSDGKVTLTSAAWNGGVFTVTGAVASDGNSMTLAWSAKGGCADGMSGSLNATWVAPMTGTWTGTATSALLTTTTSSPLTGSTITLDLQQASTPQQFAFPLSGTLSVSGAGCGFTAGTVINPQTASGLGASFISGNAFTIEAQMNDGKSLVILAGVPQAFNANQYLTFIGVSGGACDGTAAGVTLALQ